MIEFTYCEDLVHIFCNLKKIGIRSSHILYIP